MHVVTRNVNERIAKIASVAPYHSAARGLLPYGVGAPVPRRAARLTSGFRRGLFEHVGAPGRIVRVPQPPRSSRQHRVRARRATPGRPSLWYLSLGRARERYRRPDVTRTTYCFKTLRMTVSVNRRTNGDEYIDGSLRRSTWAQPDNPIDARPIASDPHAIPTNPRTASRQGDCEQ
jgi:hypothetical protein